jgi:low temperature requirement protein LtrA
LELFFDVVFVFALRALGQLMINKLNWSGAYQTLLLLLALGWVWALTARITDFLNPRRLPVVLLIFATMIGALVLSAAVPEAFGRTGLIFAVTFLVISLGRNVFLVFVLRGDERQRVAERALIWHSAAGVPWLIGAFASGTARTALWTVVVALLYLGRWLSYPVPGIRRLAGAELPPGGEYLAQRHRALFVIGLGEAVLAIGSALTGRGFTTQQTAAFVVTFLLAALVWRIYIVRAGEAIAPAMAASANPSALANVVSYSHLIMIAGIVVGSVGDVLVIQHPFGHPHAAWTITILGGAELFLIGRTTLEYVIFGRIWPDWIIWLVALVCLVPPMLFLPPLVTAIATGAILTGVVINGLRIQRREQPPVSPPGPHRDSDK